MSLAQRNGAANSKRYGRLFIATDLPEEVKEAISRTTARLPDCARPVSADKMHLTLEFLGALKEQDVEKVNRIIDGISSKQFGITIRGVGTFDRKRPKVVFASITSGSNELVAIHNELSANLKASGIITDERRYRPHITIARLYNLQRKEVQSVNEFVDQHTNDEFGSFICKEIKLKNSIMGSNGHAYSDLHLKELA
jgi:RNA 2',3'-cyclic 3'-phosphodiesterase